MRKRKKRSRAEMGHCPEGGVCCRTNQFDYGVFPSPFPEGGIRCCFCTHDTKSVVGVHVEDLPGPQTPEGQLCKSRDIHSFVG